MFGKSLNFLSIFLHGIRAEALRIQLIVGTTVVLSCWERVIAVFFNNLCVGETLSGCDLHVLCEELEKSDSNLVMEDTLIRMGSSLFQG